MTALLLCYSRTMTALLLCYSRTMTDCSSTYVSHVEVHLELEVFLPLVAAFWLQGVQRLV